MTSWRERTDSELVEMATRCVRDQQQAELELAACVDTLMDLFDEMEARRLPHARGEVIARRFEMWLADAREQTDHRAELELHAKAQRLLDDWLGR